MSGERITWTAGKWAEDGRVGGLSLFTVGYGTTRKDDMYYLTTSLPAKSDALGQHYPTPTHAKVAAETFLQAFLARIDRPTTTERPERADEERVK